MPRVCPTCGTTYDEKHVFCPADGSSLRTIDDSGELIGSVVADRYLITEQLGEGGMGRVYLAQHVRLPQQAAIKVLHPSLAHDTDALARFNREAANACQINHQHVARVYDFGEGGGGLIYLAMEYVPGQTLSALLDAAGPLPPTRAAMLLRQIASGLDAAHKLGIVHRDLKPDNILVIRDEDGTEQVKVVDFGIAKAMHSGTQGVTRTGLVVGTALYMSPEQVSGHVIDKRSDVYALGLVAFVMLTGKLPFPGDTAEEAMIRRLSERPQTLAEANGETAWPAGVQEVMDRALARDLADRYPTASAFAKALSDAVDAWQRPVQAGVAAGVAAGSPVAGSQVAEERAGVTGPGGPGSAVRDAGGGMTPVGARNPGVAARTRQFAIGGGVAILALAAIIAVANGSNGSAPVQDPADSGAPTTGDAAKAGTSPTSDAGTGNTSLGSESDSASGALSSAPVSPPPASSDNRADPPAGPPGSSSDGGSSRSPRPDPPNSDAAVEAERLARARLAAIDATLHPDSITEVAARRALAAGELLPALRTAHDSMRVDLNRAKAYFFLQRIPEACLVLESARRRATPDARVQIDIQIEILGCT